MRFTKTALLLTAFVTGQVRSQDDACTADKRLAAARQIPYAYNLQPLGASAAAFKEVPFAADCLTEM